MTDAELDERCAEVAALADVPGEEAAARLVERLAHPSWYLRERVVVALGARADGGEPLARMLREGAWWARASACDVVARRADPALADALLAAMEAPSVSLQKSAVRALEAVGDAAGIARVATRIAALDAERRRRVTARIGHQAPHWAESLDAALAALPASAFAPEPAVTGPPPAEDRDVRALVRFRRWLRGGPGAPSRRAARTAA